MAPVMVLFFVSLCLAISGIFDFVDSLPLEGARHKVVYSRYVRRRPIPFSDNFVEEVIEVFNTQRRPPPYAFLHDEDLTRFVRCDFDPSMPDCDDETDDLDTTSTIEPKTVESPFSFSPTTTTTVQPEEVNSTPTTTSSSSFWWGRGPETTTIPKTTSTTTEENVNLAESSQELPSEILGGDFEGTTSTTNTPVVSEEYVDEKNEGENGNDYDEETNQDPKSKETDDPNKTDYYDQGESAENNNNAEDENDTNADDAVEPQTKESTVEPATKKSFFQWF